MKNCMFLEIYGFFGFECENFKMHAKEKHKLIFTIGAYS